MVVARAVADGRRGVGTGFLVEPGSQRAGRASAGPEALVLTAAHVVRGAERLLVEFPEERALPAELVGYDARRDVALLRISPSGRCRRSRWPRQRGCGRASLWR